MHARKNSLFLKTLKEDKNEKSRFLRVFREDKNRKLYDRRILKMPEWSQQITEQNVKYRTK